ncbi:MAG: class I SAM-dependent methyltransferase, partial [Sphingomonadaceae bacterium]
DPEDMSDAAKAKRILRGLADLNGVAFVAKIKVEPSSDPRYGDQNRLDRVILPNEKEWRAIMSGEAVAALRQEVAALGGVEVHRFEHLPLLHLRLPAARVMVGQAEALPLDDASLDKAASVNSLYFWADLETPIGELARVLKPGGRLVLGFQTADAVRAWPGHVNGFAAWETGAIRAAVEAGGFRRIDETAAHDWRVRDYVTLVALRAG